MATKKGTTVYNNHHFSRLCIIQSAGLPCSQLTKCVLVSYHTSQTKNGPVKSKLAFAPFPDRSHAFIVSANATTSPMACNSSQFRCRDGHCIDARWHCDGNSDCWDHSDEIGCNSTNTTCDSWRQIRCNVTGGGCIYREWLCDGDMDCPNGEDESTKNCGRCSQCSNLFHPVICKTRFCIVCVLHSGEI